MRNKEKESRESEQGENRKTTDLGTGQSELPPLDVPPTTPIIGKQLPLQELGIFEDQDEDVIDLTKLTFDEINLKIVQERKKYCSRNLVEPLSITLHQTLK